MMKLRHSLIGLSLCALLAACGDSPETAEAPTANEVPASATESSRAYANFAGSLAPSEHHEPLDVNKVKPPTSETEEPQAI